MKNPVEMLKEIKNLLGVELSEQVQEEPQVVLAQLKLDNGTVLEADDFEAGKDVFILTEDEKVALPKGEYQLEDGRTLEVLEDGVINSVEVKAEETPEEEPKEEEELDETQYPTREEFDALKEMVMSIKEEMGAYGDKDDEKEMEEAEELKQELSKPAAEPIKHNPEAKTEEKKRVLYAQKRASTTLDRVINRINSIK